MFSQRRFPIVFPSNLFKALEAQEKLVQEMFSNKSLFSNYPPTDVYFNKEEENSLYMDIIVAGFNKDEIEISITDNVITIKGVHKDKNKDENIHFINQSISHKNFERSLTIQNENFIIDNVEPILENGVLHIKINIKLPQQENTKKIIQIL